MFRGVALLMIEAPGGLFITRNRCNQHAYKVHNFKATAIRIEETDNYELDLTKITYINVVFMLPVCYRQDI